MNIHSTVDNLSKNPIKHDNSLLNWLREASRAFKSLMRIQSKASQVTGQMLTVFKLAVFMSFMPL